MPPPPEEAPGTIESPPEEDSGAFDPGVETGYLRRGRGDEPPDVELGSRPFDPGDGVGFDDRRAKKRLRRREREERERAEAEEAERREAEAAAEREQERELAEAEDAERREQDERLRSEAEAKERDAAERARLEAAELELEEAEASAVAEAERARREAEAQERAEREARGRAAAIQRRSRDAEAKAKARAKEAKAAAPRRRKASPRPPAKRRVRRPARPMPPPGAEAPTGTRKTSAPPREAPSLRRPTAKLGAAALAIGVGALLLGSLAGLPTPFSGSEGGVATLNAQGVPVGSGIAASLYRGPFHPVRGEYDYGEKGAEFGADRGGRKHEGQDIFSKRGTPLVAVRDGIVVDRAKENSTYSGGRGNYLAIYSPIENRSFVYLHLLEPATVEKGDRVHAGQVVGMMGCTGSCYGTHLHFEVRRGRAAFAADTKGINPRPFLDDLPQAPAELAEP